MRKSPLMLTIAAAAFAVALTGCSAGGAETKALGYEDSPLSKYFGGATSSQSEEEMQAQFDKQSAQVEDLVAECMSKEGFEYTPVDNKTTISTSMAGQYEPDKKEWVAQYGYGMVNFPGMNDAPMEMPDDPNTTYVESLTEAERTAYETALNGSMMMPTEGAEMSEATSSGDVSTDEYNWETAGCYGAAQHEVYEDDPAMSVYEDPQFDDLMTAINELYSGQNESTDPTEADKKWASCMADAKYPDFTRQGDAIASIQEKLNAYYEKLDPESLTGPDSEEPEMKQLGEEEIELALVDLDCREKTDYTQNQMKEMFAAEEKFIEDHKAELERYKAAVDEAQKKSK